jgi:hypothetical protein
MWQFSAGSQRASFLTCGKKTDLAQEVRKVSQRQAQCGLCECRCGLYDQRRCVLQAFGGLQNQWRSQVFSVVKKACIATLGGNDEAQTHLGGLTKLQNRRHQAGSNPPAVCGDNDFSHLQSHVVTGPRK